MDAALLHPFLFYFSARVPSAVGEVSFDALLDHFRAICGVAWVQDELDLRRALDDGPQKRVDFLREAAARERDARI
jgi:hypothetical protein